MTLYLHMEAPTPESYLRLLRFTATPETREIVTFFYFGKPTRATALGRFEDVQEQFSKEREVKFRLFSTFSRHQLYPPAMTRRLVRMSCTVLFPHPRPRLELRLQRAGVRTGMQYPAPKYTPETAESFLSWLRDPAAPPEPAYTNILSALTLNIPSPDCRRSSCLTRYYYLDAQGMLYLCPHERSQRTRLGIADSAGCALELFSGESPMKLLEAAVSRRANCEGCHRFSLCQGGCPLDTGDCESYCQTVAVIEKTLKTLPDLQGLNPHATRILLHALAFQPENANIPFGQ